MKNNIKTIKFENVIINGLITSIILETIILMKQKKQKSLSNGKLI